jgi:hypothetical protein
LREKQWKFDQLHGLPAIYCDRPLKENTLTQTKKKSYGSNIPDKSMQTTPNARIASIGLMVMVIIGF